MSAEAADPFERALRLGFWWLLIVGWLPAVWLMYEALTTIPSAERLEESRLVAIPTVRMFVGAVAFSGAELAVVLALLWPWRPEFYATRLAGALLALVTWFITTTTLELNRMDWVHRRWLAGMVVGIAACLLVLLAARGIRRVMAPTEAR